MEVTPEIEGLYHYHKGELISGPHSGLTGDYSKLSGDCTDLIGDCTDLIGDCTWLYGDCTGLQGDCTHLRGDCSDIYGYCSDLRGDCTGLSGDCRSYVPPRTANKKHIEVTEYTRADGLTMFKIANGSWVIRKINGPAWFLGQDQTWIVSTRLDFKLEAHGMHFDHAMELFQTI